MFTRFRHYRVPFQSGARVYVHTSSARNGHTEGGGGRGREKNLPFRICQHCVLCCVCVCVCGPVSPCQLAATYPVDDLLVMCVCVCVCARMMVFVHAEMVPFLLLLLLPIGNNCFNGPAWRSRLFCTCSPGLRFILKRRSLGAGAGRQKYTHTALCVLSLGLLLPAAPSAFKPLFLIGTIYSIHSALARVWF